MGVPESGPPGCCGRFDEPWPEEPGPEEPEPGPEDPGFDPPGADDPGSVGLGVGVAVTGGTGLGVGCTWTGEDGAGEVGIGDGTAGVDTLAPGIRIETGGNETFDGDPAGGAPAACWADVVGWPVCVVLAADGEAVPLGVTLTAEEGVSESGVGEEPES